MRRGEVWWAGLARPIGRRPVLLLSRDEAYGVRGMVTAAPVTTRIRGIRAEVALGRADGLPRACVVNLDSIVTIDKSCLHERVAALSPEKLRAVDRAIRFALGLTE